MSVPPRALRAPLVVLLLAAPALLSSLASARQLPPPPVPPGNPPTPEKAVLGKILFWDEQLSSDNSTACGSCHVPAAGGSERRVGAGTIHPGFDGIAGTPDDVHGSQGVARSDSEQRFTPDASFGFERQVTPRWAPTTLAAAYFNLSFWDGRAGGTFVDPQSGLVVLPTGGALESQALGPPLSDVEMAHEARDWDAIVAKLALVQPLALGADLPPDVVSALALAPDYPALFQRAFGDPTLSAARIALAIASYERTLVPDRTPWDLGTLTPAQQQGLNTMAASSCLVCHAPPLFSNGTFRNVGLRPPAEDLGRQAVTGNPADRGRFKVPTLRNVGLRTRFMHNGQFDALDQVVLFYNGGGTFPDNRDPLVRPLGLGPQQRARIVDFLENGLVDPRVAAETFPFDRPLLASEQRTRLPRVLAPGVAGSGGFTPRMLAYAAPKLGAPGFKLGLASSSGGSVAYLVVGRAGELDGTQAPHGRPRELWIQALLETEGSGPGQGFATALFAPEQLPLFGPGMQAVWLVRDPAAPGGFARSEVIELDPF